MNVWLWGPTLWPLVHMVGYACDHDARIVPDYLQMTQTLQFILPCVQCRNSQTSFVQELGVPEQGKCLEWSYTLHKKVNSKLNKQRLEKIRKRDSLAPFMENDALWNTLSQEDILDDLFSNPSYEILQKRAITYGKNLWTERDVLTFCLVLCLHAQGSTTQIGKQRPKETATIEVSEEVLSKQKDFFACLYEIHKKLKGPKELLSILKRLRDLDTNLVDTKITLLCKALQPTDSIQQSYERIKLFRAGACLNGTCV